jgi:hypothetical protein
MNKGLLVPGLHYESYPGQFREEILFKGYTHSKRGSGLTTIPEKVLKLDVCEGIDVKKEIKQIFIWHFREKLKTKNAAEQT